MIDGELVALAADGTTNFADLQDRIATGRTDDLVFFAFDLLYRDGVDLTGAALEARKAALAEIVPPNTAGMVRYSDHQRGRGAEFHRHACQYELEGTVAKRADKPYRPGRGADWLKVKCLNREEFVIVGFTDPERSRQGFGALLLGYYDPDGQLRYAGRVGTGFDMKRLELRSRLMRSIDLPTVTLPKAALKKGALIQAALSPRRSSSITADKTLRHASFQGLREDKQARRRSCTIRRNKAPTRNREGTRSRSRGRVRLRDRRRRAPAVLDPNANRRTQTGRTQTGRTQTGRRVGADGSVDRLWGHPPRPRCILTRASCLRSPSITRRSRSGPCRILQIVR
jgi:bifunctional non-homologous end joining protein LigD